MTIADERAKAQDRDVVDIMISGQRHHADRSRVMAALRMSGRVATLSPTEFVTGVEDDGEPGWRITMWAEHDELVDFVRALHGQLGEGRCALIQLGSGAICSRVWLEL
jgi:hypothetical protein